jgi:hypothetical protein
MQPHLPPEIFGPLISLIYFTAVGRIFFWLSVWVMFFGFAAPEVFATAANLLLVVVQSNN